MNLDRKRFRISDMDTAYIEILFRHNYPTYTKTDKQLIHKECHSFNGDKRTFYKKDWNDTIKII